MEVKELTIRFITPSEGSLLYNEQINTYSSKVQLGCNDNINNWKEIEVSTLDSDTIDELKEQGVL